MPGMNASARLAQRNHRLRVTLAIVAVFWAGAALADDPTPDPAEPYFVIRANVAVDTGSAASSQDCPVVQISAPRTRAVIR